MPEAPGPSAGRDLLALVRLLVERPHQLRVQEVGSEKSPVLVLHLDPEDRGRVIGRRGRTIQALRHLLEARARSQGVRYGLELERD